MRIERAFDSLGSFFNFLLSNLLTEVAALSTHLPHFFFFFFTAMPTGKLQSKRDDGSDKPNVVDEPDGDGAPQVLRGDGGDDAIAPEVAVPVRGGRRFTW
jgi:hypothetical protein